MSKHTPAPWKYAENDGAYATIRGDDGECPNQSIARVWLQGPEFSDANADRIEACVNACEGIEDPSAVPEILKAAQRIIGEMNADQGNFSIGAEEDLRAAIARAEGRK